MKRKFVCIRGCLWVQNLADTVVCWDLYYHFGMMMPCLGCIIRNLMFIIFH